MGWKFEKELKQQKVKPHREFISRQTDTEVGEFSKNNKPWNAKRIPRMRFETFNWSPFQLLQMKNKSWTISRIALVTTTRSFCFRFSFVSMFIIAVGCCGACGKFYLFYIEEKKKMGSCSCFNENGILLLSLHIWMRGCRFEFSLGLSWPECRSNSPRWRWIDFLIYFCFH